MYTGLVHLHSFLPYFVIAGLAISAVLFLSKYSSGKPFSGGDRKLAMFTLMAVHIQLVVGLVLYIYSPIRQQAFSSGELMSNSVYRFTAIEHPLMMILAVILVTVGYSRAKRTAEDKAKHRKLGLMYGLALILILSRIPWESWPAW